MNRRVRAGLTGVLLLAAVIARADGNLQHQETGDVLFRDLKYTWGLNVHGGVYWELTPGNPDDRNYSVMIEMLGKPTPNGIVTNSVQNFIDAAKFLNPFAFHGAYGHRVGPLPNPVRRAIIKTMRDMETRAPTPIVYVSTFAVTYLTWNDDGGPLTIDKIVSLRSDATVEFAYALNGFPIIQPNGYTIINNPNLFNRLAKYPFTGLRPSDQQADMVPAIIDNPKTLVHDGAGNPIATGGFTNADNITVDVFDQFSGPGRLELWQGGVNAGTLLAVNNDAALGTDATYDNTSTGLGVLQNTPEGQYAIRAIDRAGNHGPESEVNFTISHAYPNLTVLDASGQIINDGEYTDNAFIDASSFPGSPNVPIQDLEFFRNGSSFLKTTSSVFLGTFPTNSWYYVQACDVASNCSGSAFGIFPPGTTPPAPPNPPTPPSPKKTRPQPPHPKQPPQPACLVSLVTCTVLPAVKLPPGGPPPGTPPPGLPFLVPGDPNSMSGPQGPVVPGQLMTYTIEFENVGDGLAQGVYIKDVLDSALDDTVLSVRDMYRLTFSSGVPVSTTAASFPWSYDPQTRTVTLLAGNSGPNAGGSFVLEARLKATSPPGTIIPNQAFVYFPNALQQITPTNSIISAVPLPTQIASVGASSGVYLSTAGLSAELSAGTKLLSQQTINFQLISTTATAVTDVGGLASTALFLSTAAGNYNLGFSYPGDGFYYLPATTNFNFSVSRRASILQAPYASSRATDTVHLTLNMTDDQGQALLHQSDEPKTIFLELQTGTTGAATLLASSVLSGISVSFQFLLPRPFNLTWPIRARFDGDSHYASVVSTGVLSLVDASPPSIAIASPVDGQVFLSNAGVVSVGFSIQDDVDPSPHATANLVSANGLQSLSVSNGAQIPTTSLSTGTWALTVRAVDWAGNTSLAAADFEVAADTLPPHTTLLVDGLASTAAGLILVSTDTLGFLAADARSGVFQTLYSVDASSPIVVVSTFSLSIGTHTLAFQSIDNVGNVEPLQTVSVAVMLVDTIPPTITVQPVSGSTLTTPTPTLSVLYSDAGRGIDATSVRLSLDGLDVTSSATVTASSAAFVPLAALSQTTHTFAVQVADLAGNVSSATATFLVDSVPPVTTLLVDGLAPGTTSLVIFSTNSVGFAANDAGTGVLQTLYSLDGSSIAAVYNSTFSLSVGTHTLAYHSVDRAGNVEPFASVALSVLPPDSLPPRTSLAIGVPRFGPGPVYISTATPLGFTAIDDKSVVGDGAGLGVARTLYAVDSGSFTIYSGTFILSAEGLHAIRFYSVDGIGNTETVQVSSIAVDATAPASIVSVGSPTYTAADGTIYVATTTPVAFSSADPMLASSTVAGSGVSRVEVAIDSAPFAPYTAALTFAEGRHAILYRAIDNVGNAEASHLLALSADASPPSSTLAIGQPQFQLSSTTVLVSSLTPFGIQAVDLVVNGVASGIRQTFYALDGGTFAVFAASFTLPAPDGPRGISFYSQDNVLNPESAKIVTVVLDATPPEISLLSPGSCPGGICRVVKGKFPVLGTARDLHFGNYVLDYAPGQNAASGFTLVSSGTVAVSSGVLGTWDVSALPGWQTLRLTATDLVANVSALTINVFVGDPGELMILGNHDVFDLPQGVAIDAGGNIYVADANADRVAVFTATGTFVTAYGRPRGERDDQVSTSTVRLNKPKGVAVDPAGNIYVADTNDDRVLKFSAAGQVLLAIGRRENADKDHDAKLEFHPGKGPGEFNKPSGVALDSSGNIYVADTNNNRVQVLNSTGAFRLAFNLPPLPKQRDDDKDDHDSDQPALGRPFGIAVDAAGKVYVADTSGSRALVFGATGQLLLTLPIAGAAKDGMALYGRPEGIAVSTNGYCLFVSDRKLDRVLKFDAFGDQTLVFGSPGKLGDDKPAPGIVFRKPVGLALASDGTLLVADRNNDRVERFGLPSGKPALVVPPSSGDDASQVAKDVLDRDEGGAVARSDRAGVAIPPGALPEDLKVTVSTPSIGAADESDRRHAADAAQLKTASPPVEYGPEGTKFAAPVTLTLPYSQDLVALEGVDETDLRVRYWNRDKAQWENLDTVVDPKTRTVTAKTTHFSLYQVFSGTASAAGLRPLAVGDPTFMFHDAYAFPNPVRGTSVVTIRIQPGLADSVEVRAYDVSGRKVYSSSNFSLNPGLDDGNGKGIQYTYDNVWDISGVGSGVYQYVITAKKSGNSDIHKAGRLAVVK